MQGATAFKHCFAKIIDKVSIHAPYAGSDDIQLYLKMFCEVSIHAPYAGSDKNVKI